MPCHIYFILEEYEMIKKYKFGNPIETDAVIVDLPVEKIGQDYFHMEPKDGGFLLTYGLGKHDIVYGLGEQVRGINKRGWRYESNCSDDPLHTETKRSLYGAHNFLIIDGKVKLGIFIDFPGYIFFDIGCEDLNKIQIKTAGTDMYIYAIEDDKIPDIVKEFRHLIGRSYIAPFWGMGYQQSRWGYKDEKDILEVAENYRKNNIPLDAIYMDIDYMERYKDFTIDKEKFPDLKKLNSDLKNQGIRLVPIIDAGVKIEKGYDVYEEGVKNNYFCKRDDGTDFVAGVWPGKTHFPDMLNKDARKWFGDKYKILLDYGIEGFWNDMNEPAIFYSEEGLQEALEKYSEITSKPLDITGFFALQNNFCQLADNQKDHTRFYHNIDGQKIVHEKVHNLYGYNMTRAAGEAFDRLSPEKRILLFSRSSYIGMHRYGGIWTGDNQSWWSHILLNIKQMPSLNMCGYIYSGADIGGFGGDTTADLLLRWLQLGVFTPLFRNHSAIGTLLQEPYRFQNMEDMKNVINIRYMLIPHIYTEYMNSVLNDEMYFKPLAFDFPNDLKTKNIEDQLMLGDSIMITPIYEQNARGRFVYLPEDMLFVKYKAGGRREEKVLKEGYHFIKVELEETPLFIRKNCFIPLVKSAVSTDKIDYENLELLGYIEDNKTVSYTLYQDDGFSKDYENKNNYKQIIINKSSNTTKVKAPADKNIVLTIY